jgi:hypothetical protein
MAVKTVTSRVNMRGDTHIENLTQSVQTAVADCGLSAGIVTVFVKHTTASVMIIEDEPGIRADTKAFWDRTVPARSSFGSTICGMPVKTMGTAIFAGSCRGRPSRFRFPRGHYCWAHGSRLSSSISIPGLACAR